MKEVIRYQTKDNKLFDTAEEATAHEKILEEIEECYQLLGVKGINSWKSFMDFFETDSMGMIKSYKLDLDNQIKFANRLSELKTKCIDNEKSISFDLLYQLILVEKCITINGHLTPFWNK